jgi:Zn-dependent protease
VLAQGVLLMATVALLDLMPPKTPFGVELAVALTLGNATMAAFNLIPFRGLDGVEAWKIFRLLLERSHKRQREQKARARMMAKLRAATELSRLESLDTATLDDDADAVVGELLKKTTRRIETGSD